MEKLRRIMKEDVALNQLITAIELFNKKNYISSITLAGAAEEIFGGMAAQKSGTGASSNLYVKGRNKIKNELKHPNTKKTLRYSDFKATALDHITHAIDNYRLYKGRLPKATEVIDFVEDMKLFKEINE